ncbi:hypothetical protein [Streptomyces scabiei]|nr:hypothetical protein [Streptomyces sp. LBUM 1488]
MPTDSLRIEAPPTNGAAPVAPAKNPYAVARRTTGTRLATVTRHVGS